MEDTTHGGPIQRPASRSDMGAVSGWMQNAFMVRRTKPSHLAGVAKTPQGIALRIRRADGMEMVLDLSAEDLRRLDERRRAIQHSMTSVIGNVAIRQGGGR